jgi:hypothetical protein
MTLKEGWKIQVRKYRECLSLKQLALILTPNPDDYDEYRKKYQKIYRDIQKGLLDYTQMGEERNMLLITVEDALDYIDRYKDSNPVDMTPPTKNLFPDFHLNQ